MDCETAYYSFKKARLEADEKKAENMREDTPAKEKAVQNTDTFRREDKRAAENMVEDSEEYDVIEEYQDKKTTEEEKKNLDTFRREDKRAAENMVEDVDAEVQEAVHQADFEQEEDEEEDWEFQALEKHAQNLEKLNKWWKWTTAVAVLGTCLADVLLYQKSREYGQNMDQADTYLKEAVTHVKDDAKTVRCYYADAIYQTLKANPNQDIVTVTETAIRRVDEKPSAQMPEYQRYVVRKDLMRMAQTYAETNGPRKDFAEILIAYGRGRCGSYVDEKTQPQEVQKNIQAYLKFYASLGQARENQR